jgi:hypothetical protein
MCRKKGKKGKRKDKDKEKEDNPTENFFSSL